MWEWVGLPGSVPLAGQGFWPQKAGQKREVGLHRTLNMAAVCVVLAAQGCM